MTYSSPRTESPHTRHPSTSSAASGISAYSTNSIAASRSSTISSNSSTSSRYGLSSVEEGLAKMSMVSGYTTTNGSERSRDLPRARSTSPTKAMVNLFNKGAPEQTPRPARKLDFNTSTTTGLSTATPSFGASSPHYQDDTNVGSYSHKAHSPERPMINRPTSMILTSAHSGAHTPMSVSSTDFNTMKNSSVSHFRTLSKDSGQVMGAIPTTRNVAGMAGRKRLTRAQTTGEGRSEWAQRDWMDRQRKYMQAYEYLCHIGEAKEWIEACISEEIPPIVQLEEAMRNGIILARLVKTFAPDLVPRIFMDPKLQFRHSDNTVRFFKFVERIGLPDIFVFELTDLYDKKNIPKVIYCIHALSFMLFRLGMTDNAIGNLVGKLEFTEEELMNTQRGIDNSGVSLPSFSGVGKHFEPEPEPEPEPVESEEDRIERELYECEASIAELQALAKGALMRVKLGWMMDDLWATEATVIRLQAMVRGMFARSSFAYKADMAAWATDLQTLARGFKARRELQSKQRLMKRNATVVTKLQSAVRAKKVRNEHRQMKRDLSKCTPAITKLQAAIRGALHRNDLANHMDNVYDAEQGVAGLQSLVRGVLVRQKIQADARKLSLALPAIKAAQAACRGYLHRNKHARNMRNLGAGSWPEFQARIRGGMVRKDLARQMDQLKQFSPKATLLQAMARGVIARDEFSDIMNHLASQEPEITILQAVARGLLTRESFQSKIKAIAGEQSAILNLQARARGALSRGRGNVFLAELHTSYTDDVESLQACIRGALARRNARYTIECLVDEEPEVVDFQSLARGAIARRAYHGKLKHYNDNMQKVVKLQSFVRARQQGEAYRSLTTGANPPVGTIKNFVHLLNDSDFDFNEEIEFERKRKTVVQHVRANEMQEQYIEQLDIKIGLLIRNKITLDEVVKYQKLGGHGGGMSFSNVDLNSTDPFDLKALNKNSRRKLELYQMLFYALQTQPSYLSRLFIRVRAVGMAEKELKKLENLVIGLFGYATKRREEFFLLKLIGRSIKDELEGCKAPEDYLRGTFFWSRLMVNYIRSPRDKTYMKNHLGPVIIERLIEAENLDLESNPLQIYRTIINNEELSTGRKSQRKQDISREEAIRDPDTRQIFVLHLEDLRDICESFLDVLEENVARLPFGVRHLAQVSYQTLCEVFPDEEHNRLLRIVQHFVFMRYFNPVIVGPESCGITDKKLTPMQKKNLEAVSKVMNQISAGLLFTLHDDVYLQPLNDWMGEANDRMLQLFRKLVEVPTIEKYFHMDVLDDLTSRQNPTLWIKMADVFALHATVTREVDFIATEPEDQIRDLIRELGTVKSGEDQLQRATGSEIHLSLNPRMSKLEDPDAEVKALFVETKRCILYIIRVQTGGNLMEILVKPITTEDDERWAGVVDEETSGKKRGAYADAAQHTLSDISLLTYGELKKTALENVLRLEQMGKISRANQFQDVLNAIATDIRTKHIKREQRRRELDGVKQTLSHLQEKSSFLEEKLKSYNDYIEQAMGTLQSTKKKGKRGFIFSRQYFHIRELERSGKVPKFGSFKYSARNLFEKSVLVSMQGYNERQYDKISFTMSSDEVGVFFIEASYGNTLIPGASASVPLDDFLQAQFNNLQFLTLFEGMVKFNVNLFLHLLFRKFYRDE